MEPIKKIKLMGQDGFTLAEIVVAAALVGVLAMALTSQMRLVGNSKRDSTERAIINRLTDKLSVELSKQETCSKIANFGGKVLGAGVTNITSLVDSANANIIVDDANYGEDPATGQVSTTASSKYIQVSSITITQNPANTTEMNLEITFKKIAGGLLSGLQARKVNLPITVERDPLDPTKIKYCYNDITSSIVSAIRLSCNGNNSFYDATINAPYGACSHNVDSVSATLCTGNTFIRRAESNFLLSKLIRFTCGALQTTCPTAGQVINGFNASGNPTCVWPFVTCAPGKLMVKSAAGPYVCLNTEFGNALGCAGLYALKSFNADGSVTCARYYPDRTCATKVESISPAGITCSENFRTVTCGAGEFLSSFDSTGQGICTKFVNPKNCPAGEGATGVDSNGDLTCQPFMRKWCNGTANLHTNSDCTNAGGSVVNPGSNQVCKFVSSSCAAGWTQCPTWATTNTTSCTDTHSSCAVPVQTRYSFGAGFATSVSPYTTQCYRWTDIPMDGNQSGSVCNQAIDTTTTNSRIEIGCY